LNNHDAPFNPPSTVLITNMFVYDDSGQNNIIGAQPSDGPGSLNRYVGQQGIGPWMLTEVDDSLTQTGAVAGFNLLIEPHQPLGKGFYGTIYGNSWWYGYIDVPSGTTSLMISATNLTLPPSLTPPLELYIKDGAIPTLTDTNEYGPIGLTNGTPPGNSITINSPTPGRYWISLYNGSAQQQLGKPYVYGAAGPNSFDCSGLAMYCYAQIGISLSHGATDQQRQSTPVSLGDLRPGDLVFFGSSSYSHHVAIYAGGGSVIEAPHTGAVVGYGPLGGRDAWIGGRF